MEIDFEKQAHEMTEAEEQRIRQGINELVNQCHGNAVRKQWWNPAPTFGEGLMLIVSELSESLEDYRKGLQPGMQLFDIGMDNPYLDLAKYREQVESLPPDQRAMLKDKPVGIPSELADVLIRLCDLCGGFEVPLADAVIAKMRYNRTRPERHGGKKL